MTDWNRLFPAFLAALLLVTGCSTEPSPPPLESGRYLEQEISYPGGRYIFSMTAGTNGADLFTRDMEEWTVEWHTLSQDAFTPTQAGWLAGIPEGWNPVALSNASGETAALFQEAGEDGILAHLCRADGDKLEEIPFDAEPGQQLHGFCLNEDGAFAIRQDPWGVVLYTAGGEKRAEIPGGISAVFFGDRLAVCDEEAVTFYDLGGDQQESVPHEGGRGALAAGPDGGLTLALASGLYRFTADGAWERFVDGTLCSLSNPNYILYELAVLPGGEYLVRCGDRAAERDVVLAYRFSADVSPEPEHTLTVCSLLGHDTVQLAAIEAQRANSDLRVTLDIRYPDADDVSETEVSDALKSINTELLAGKGADVYVLNRMPYASYVEKGVLRDLNGFLAPYLEKGTLLGNVVEGCRSGDGMFLLPVRFSIPLLWGDGEALGAVNDLSSLADWAQAHPEPPVFYQMNAQSVFDLYFPLSVPDDETRLREFLEDIRRVSGSAPAAERFQPEWGVRYDEAGRLAGLNQLIARTVVNPVALVECNEIMRQTGGGTCRVLAGQVPDVFLTRLLVGVNAASAQQELADEFLAVLLSESVQDLTFYSEEGLPVNAESLRKAVDSAVNGGEEGLLAYYYYDEEYEDVLELECAWLTEEEGAQFLKLCRSVATPGVDDEVLEGMIRELAQPYWNGEQTIDEAMTAIGGKIRAYLGE